MFKYELGQEVVYYPQKYRGVIAGMGYTPKGLPYYRVESIHGMLISRNVLESDIVPYTRKLDFIEKQIEKPFIIQEDLKKTLKEITNPFPYMHFSFDDVKNKTDKELIDSIQKDYFDYQKNILGVRTPIEPKYYNFMPSKVYFNDKKKATTIMYGDNATVVKCGDGDTYSRRVGFLEAYFQATCGMSKTKAKKYLNDITKEEEIDYVKIKKETIKNITADEIVEIIIKEANKTKENE